MIANFWTPSSDRVLHIEHKSIPGLLGQLFAVQEQKRTEELALLQALQTRQIAAHCGNHHLRQSLPRQRDQVAGQAQSRLKMLQRMERIVPRARG